MQRRARRRPRKMAANPIACRAPPYSRKQGGAGRPSRSSRVSIPDYRHGDVAGGAVRLQSPIGRVAAVRVPFSDTEVTASMQAIFATFRAHPRQFVMVRACVAGDGVHFTQASARELFDHLENVKDLSPPQHPHTGSGSWAGAASLATAQPVSGLTRRRSTVCRIPRCSRSGRCRGLSFMESCEVTRRRDQRCGSRRRSRCRHRAGHCRSGSCWMGVVAPLSCRMERY
jgi:hypothetical protein